MFGNINRAKPSNHIKFVTASDVNPTANDEPNSAPIIAAIKSAIGITAAAFRRILGFVKPGVREYEVEAEITHEFIRRGAQGHAYQPIIGSGANACRGE